MSSSTGAARDEAEGPVWNKDTYNAPWNENRNIDITPIEVASHDI